MTHDETGIRLTVHDASRLEWVATVPLAEANTSEERFSLTFELEVPASLHSNQDHWPNIQMLSRLQSPLDRIGCSQPSQVDSPDELKELALAVAHRVKLLRQAFTRECFMANSLLALEPTGQRLKRLVSGFEAVSKEVNEARSLLDNVSAKGPDLLRERRLCEEYLSNQILDFLFHAHRAIEQQLLRPDGVHTEALREVAHGFEAAVAEAVRQELIYREQQGFLTPTSDRPEVLERYLERSSLLKKHFHELLFLSPKYVAMDTRIRDYGGIVGAMAASLLGFGLNTGLFKGPLATAGLGLGMAATLGAAVYALQDRVKDLGKNYLSGKLGKFYAQRQTKLFLPERSGKNEGRLIAELRESFHSKKTMRPDLLNPELGARQEVVTLRYSSTGFTRPQPELNARGIACMKQVFRFDMSWLLSRLDDAFKTVPVLHPEGNVRLAEAPRCYRMPVSVVLQAGGRTYRREAIAVLHKRGLERLEMNHDVIDAAAPQPAEAIA